MTVELEYIWIFSSDEIFYKLKLTGGGWREAERSKISMFPSRT